MACSRLGGSVVLVVSLVLLVPIVGPGARSAGACVGCCDATTGPAPYDLEKHRPAVRRPAPARGSWSPLGVGSLRSIARTRPPRTVLRFQEARHRANDVVGLVGHRGVIQSLCRSV